MKLRGNGLVIIFLVGVIFLASTYIIFGQGQSAKQQTQSDSVTIKVNMPVTMSQCSSCHADLDTFSKLKFNHWIHFKKGLACKTCHDQWPHQQGKIILPKMKTCNSCHGLKHGSKGLLAPSECSTCHKNNVKQSSQASVYQKLAYGTIPEPKKASFDEVVLEKEVKAGTCFNCHFDLNANQPAGLKFTHWPHFKKGITCKTCHQGPIHLSGSINRPQMTSCFRCHGLKHNVQGKVAPDNCDTCHKPTFNLKPAWHGSNWRKVHKNTVKKEVNVIKYKTITSITSLSCLNCHDKQFCQNCHYTKLKHKPAGYLKPELRKTRHEKAHYQKDKLCDACHDRKTFCQKCHKVEMPHPYNWMLTHRPQVKEKRETCGMCHKKTLFCNSCHHSGVKPILKAKVCNECHESFMKQPRNKLVAAGVKAAASGKPLEARQYRRFVYHKVHFRKNFSCTRCHKDNFELKKEVFELCKNAGCHPLGQKKPPSGAALCQRCHINPHMGKDMAR